MDTRVLWDGCNTDDNEIALLGNQAVLKEELTDLADNAGVPELAVPELAVPQLPEPFVPFNSFPFSHAMVTGEWPHPSVPIVSVAHGAHLTLRTIYQRAFQKLVNSRGEWTSTWAPLEARQAQTAHVFALSGYPAPCTKVWARLFAAWESYGLGTYSRAGSHGARSPANFAFGPPPTEWWNPDHTHLYQGKLTGVTLTRGCGARNSCQLDTNTAGNRAAPDARDVFASCLQSMSNQEDPAWIIEDIWISPRGLQFSMSHPQTKPQTVNVGDLLGLLHSQPPWGLRILKAPECYAKERRAEVCRSA